MPTLRFKAVPKETVLQFAERLTDSLAMIFETPQDNISIEIAQSMYIRNGKIDQEPYPIVEIVAFKRSEIIETQAATEITDTLRDAGYEYCEVIYFHPEKEDYYCDGQQCQ